MFENQGCELPEDAGKRLLAAYPGELERIEGGLDYTELFYHEHPKRRRLGDGTVIMVPFVVHVPAT